MCKIAEFKYRKGRLGFDWVFDGKTYSMESSNPLVVVPFQTENKFLVVDPASDEAPHNGIIIDAKGAELNRIINPESTNGAICFSDAYYVNDELTLVIAFSSFQMACVIDKEGGVQKIRGSR